MKKLILLFLLCYTISYSQIPNTDTIRFTKTCYWGIYSKSLHYPILISWWDTKLSVKCFNQLPRVNKFHNDLVIKEANNLKDYKNSKFDKGHNKPTQDSECEGTQAETDCFSMVNMTMQYHKYNAGSWYHLEEMTRNIAGVVDSVHVWCGSLGVMKVIGNTSIPLRQWKVIYIVRQKTYRAFLFNNTINDSTNGKNGTEVPVSKVIKLTGFKF
jgi:endonuclease G